MRLHPFVTVFALILVTSTPAIAQEKIQVGGHQVEVIRTGTTGPLIVLETGLGEAAASWGPFGDSVATVGRVFAYSRAGIGGSQVRSEIRSPAEIAIELHDLLKAAGEHGPFILVGHSIGALYARVYAARYPSDVSALVLIDGSHERQFVGLMQLDSAGAAMNKKALDNASSLTPAGAEMVGFRDIMLRGSLDSADATLPDVPLALVTSMKVSAAGGPLGSKAGRVMWRQLQNSLLENVSLGVQMTTSKAGHYIHKEQPAIVMDALRWAIQATRTTRK